MVPLYVGERIRNDSCLSPVKLDTILSKQTYLGRTLGWVCYQTQEVTSAEEGDQGHIGHYVKPNGKTSLLANRYSMSRMQRTSLRSFSQLNGRDFYNTRFEHDYLWVSFTVCILHTFTDPEEP